MTGSIKGVQVTPAIAKQHMGVSIESIPVMAVVLVVLVSNRVAVGGGGEDMSDWPAHLQLALNLSGALGHMVSSHSPPTTTDQSDN